MIFSVHLVDSLLPLERLLGSWRFPEFPTDKQKNLESRAQILANPISLVAVKCQIPSRYFAFCRIPHRILAKSRISRIPFQTLSFMIPPFFFLVVFQPCSLQNRVADQVPSSNPDSPHQSFDECSFDSDGELRYLNRGKIAADTLKG